ncbi:hypothetical protein JYK14_27745 [Siccirubricoccus sp. KC 17139]|uniref:Uncharacterized protein n=1 Tax=Siccirubricoccus soli TaxID=2899147 RepID=A0ABT1DDB4_9PROT|nr:hypothetical protein [Siccirubricoccus soli]MCO6419926.1 hypothetical protein [Siccirubricoccus soli]MCP2686061.1 hypothetical protein [Siccirubricoccus soli]
MAPAGQVRIMVFRIGLAGACGMLLRVCRAAWLTIKLLAGRLLAWQLVGCVMDRFVPIYSASAETPEGRGPVTLDL